MNQIVEEIATQSSTLNTEDFGILHISKSGLSGSSVHWKQTNDLDDVKLYVIARIQNFDKEAIGTPFEKKEGMENLKVFHSFTENSFIVEWEEKEFDRVITYNHTFFVDFPKSEVLKILWWNFDKKHEYWDLHGFGSDVLFRLSAMLNVEYNQN